MYGAVREEVSESWLHTYDLSSTMIPNVSSPANDEEHFCKLILYKEIRDSGVRIWDVVILVPNLLFLLFIAVRFNRARLKLRATSSPIFLAFYGLVICNVVISVIRCVVSMTVNAAATVGGKADKVLWVTVRFFLLSTEMSVVIFGLAFGHLDSRSSIRRVLLATSLIALAFTITQGTLELVLPDDTFRIASRNFYVFGHGGMMFWFCSSLVFTMIYLFILILPWTRLRDRLTLPTKKSFYIYAGTLAALDLVQSIGAGFLNYTQNPVGLCIVDFTAAVYLTLFTPLVYHTFLSEFFGVSQPSIMFSYKAQVDDAMDEDTVSLPHQQSFSSLKTDSDYIYQVHTPSIYMPLHDSQASTSSPLKHKTSLHSLTSTAKTSSGHMTSYGSPTAVRRSTSDVRGLARRLSEDKTVLKNYQRTRSDNSIDTKRSTPDLRLPDTGWKSKSTSQFKHGDGSGSVSNSFLFPDTASKFLVKPGVNDSNINLFSLTRRSSLDRKQLGENVSARFVETPPLEKALRSILDRNFRNCPEPKHGIPDQREVSLNENIVRIAHNAGESGSSNRREISEADDALTDQTDVAKATDRLIFKPSANERAYTKRKKKDAKRVESGGLSDYLLSMTSSGVRKAEEERNAGIDPGSSSFPHTKSYAQTDSL